MASSSKLVRIMSSSKKASLRATKISFSSGRQNQYPLVSLRIYDKRTIFRFGIEFNRNKFRNILTSTNLCKWQFRNHSDPYLIWCLLYRLEGLWSISYMQPFISATVSRAYPQNIFGRFVWLIIYRTMSNMRSISSFRIHLNVPNEGNCETIPQS